MSLGPTDRRLAQALGGVRVLFGVGVLVAPDLVVRALVGRSLERRTLTALRRGLAARDLAVGLATLVAAPDQPDRSVVGLLAAGAACDAVDAAAVVVHRRSLPVTGRRFVLAASLSGTAAQLVVARRLAANR